MCISLLSLPPHSYFGGHVIELMAPWDGRYPDSTATTWQKLLKRTTQVLLALCEQKNKCSLCLNSEHWESLQQLSILTLTNS